VTFPDGIEITDAEAFADYRIDGAETLSTFAVGDAIEVGPGWQGPKGDKGDKGDPGDAFLVHEQTTPAATWTIVHNFGRLPVIQLTVGGRIVLTDVELNDTQAVVMWPGPITGTAVLA
jgi:hypothetical protein